MVLCCFLSVTWSADAATAWAVTIKGTNQRCISVTDHPSTHQLSVVAAVLKVAASRQVAKQVATEVNLRILAPSVGLEGTRCLSCPNNCNGVHCLLGLISRLCISCVDCWPSCVSPQRKAFCPHFVCRQGGDLLDCSVGGLRAGPEATGVRLHGEGISALPN